MGLKKNAWIILLTTVSVFETATAQDHREIVSKLHVADGFKISVFADNLPEARSLAIDDKGIVYVGTGSLGKVYAVEDSNHDGVADKTYNVATELYRPNGVAVKDGNLYVAEVNRILRFDDIGNKLSNPPKAAIIYDKLPSDKHHGWKYLKFGPDGKLYSGIGAPCNICKPDAPFASLFRINDDGSQFELLAQGIRNTVGFDWQPDTDILFFNENGRDHLGDDMPPDELNRWSKKGEHFGYPHCHAGEIPDEEFAANTCCKDFTAPSWKYKAHNAPLGMTFYRGKQFPGRFHHQLFTALHGSWNRSKPDGYRVSLIRFEGERPVSETPFIDGWLTLEGQVLGRPVDILERKDGSLLISDDEAGLIYQVRYQDKQ